MIWAAQSNGLGANGAVYSSPYANPNRADIKAQKYTKIGVTALDDVWGNLRPNQPLADNWHGPDLPAAIDLVDTYGKSGVHVIMRALGSTSFAVDWLPTDTSGASGQEYRALRDRVITERAANPSVCAGARAWVVINIGEQDALDATNAGNYGANCREFMRQAMRWWGTSTRFVLVLLHTGCTRTHASTVRSAQIAIGTEWTGRVITVDPSGICTVSGDGVHYDDKGLAVGQAIATAIAGAPA